MTGDGAGAANRGVAVAGDRVFMVGNNAHILALNRFTGEQIWDTEMADTHQNYFTSSAPLAIGNLVVTGPAGGEGGSRGFVAAYDQATGKEVWRFWTVPLPGEPKSETWQGAGLVHGGAPTWFTGTYDAELDTVYWPTGNPAAEYNGDERKGDNLYSDCILALDAKTGKLKWYLPVHSARSLGLGRDGNADADRHEMAGAAAQADDPSQPQRILLRVRSHRWKAASRQAVS